MDVEATPTFLATAASRSTQSTTGRFTMSVSGPGSGGRVTATSEGSYDTRAKRISVTSGVGDAGAALAAAARTELFVDGSTAYLRSAALRGVLGTDKWVKLDRQDLTGMGGGMALGVWTEPPTADLDLLRGATEVKQTGRERVRGTKTTRMHATVDLAAAVEATPAERRPLLEAARSSLAANQSGALPVDVWIGGDGLVRRLRLGVDAGGGARAAVTVDYYGYGDHVRLTPPAPGEVSKVSPDRLLSGLDDQGS